MISREAVSRVFSEVSEYPVIVEGKNDELALKSLGLSDILPIYSRPLIDVVQSIAARGVREVVILTDFDREGRKIDRKLEMMLRMHRIEPSHRLRYLVRSLGRATIEEFNGIMEDDIYGEISANVNQVSRQSSHQGKGSHRKTRRYWSDFWANRRAARVGA